MAIASVVVLTGTLRHQRDLQALVSSTQIMGWGEVSATGAKYYGAALTMALNGGNGGGVDNDNNGTTTATLSVDTINVITQNEAMDLPPTKSTTIETTTTAPPPPTTTSPDSNIVPSPLMNLTAPANETTKFAESNNLTVVATKDDQVNSSMINETIVAVNEAATSTKDTTVKIVLPAKTETPLPPSNVTATNVTTNAPAVAVNNTLATVANTTTQDASPTEATTSTTPPSNTTAASSFHRYEGVVIATKLHGPHQQLLLDRSLCLLQAAYNRKVNYDIVVFYTEDLIEEEMEVTRQLVAPAKVTFAKDNRGFQEEVAALSPIRRENFLRSCGTNSSKDLNWWSECPTRVAYNWQAEFRSWQIWTHPALRPYKTMLWLDTDGFATREWNVDPVKTMIENDLAILFMNWPMGAAKGRDVQERTFEAFNKTICSMKLKDGHFHATYGDSVDACPGKVGDIHGFFHITNLEFFRSLIVQRFEELWIGDGFLQRKYDDQYAVTAPAAILAPERSWDMHSNGIQLDVFHNGVLDGKRNKKAGGYLKYWKQTVQHQFPEAVAKCSNYIKAGMR